MSITVQEFFPDTKSNLTTIKWAHATNSQAALKKALESSETHMIEADVVLGTLTTQNSTDLIPIMGHPPNKTSDLSLESFLKQVTENKKKGIKLDFKSIEAFNASIKIIKALENLTVPLWINADILKGPVNATENPKPVDATAFLKDASHELPQTLLSIGWTTRLEDTNGNATSGKYLKEQIDAMVKVIKEQKVNQSITYPVRACFAANDVNVLQELLSSTKANNPTVTIWSSEGDKVDPAKLSTVIKTIGIDKVFVDVPQQLWEKLTLSSSAFTAKSSFSVLLASMLVALSAVKLL